MALARVRQVEAVRSLIAFFAELPDWPWIGLPLVERVFNERVFNATWDRCRGAHKGMDAREPPRVSPTPAHVAHSPFSQAAAALRALSVLPRVSSDPTLALLTRSEYPVRIFVGGRFFPRKK